jgi:hypothetical protein
MTGNPNRYVVVKGFILILILLFTVFGNAIAGNDADTLAGKSDFHSPRKATILSAILPGAGQAYNKKYWKMPIIYAGMFGLGYLVKTNNEEYNNYKDAYKLRLDGDPATTDEYVGVYSDQDLVTLKDYYRRNRDLSALGIGVIYILNILDAAVDAHLYHFNVSDDLTLDITPFAIPAAKPIAAVNFCFRF